MGIATKIAIGLSLYAVYKIGTEKEFEELRSIFMETLKTLRPQIINMLDMFEFTQFGFHENNFSRNEKEIERQIFLLKNSINNINAEKLANKIVSSTKKVISKESAK